MKSGNLNFLEPSGPLQVCNGTALPLPLPWCNTSLCHYAILLKVTILNLTFVVSCIVNVFFLSITNKMLQYTIFFIIVNALHVSDGFSAHHQELKNCTAVAGSKLGICLMLSVQFLSS